MSTKRNRKRKSPRARKGRRPRVKKLRPRPPRQDRSTIVRVLRTVQIDPGSVRRKRVKERLRAATAKRLPKGLRPASARPLPKEGKVPTTIVKRPRGKGKVVRGLRLYIKFRGNPGSPEIKNKEGRFVKHERFVRKDKTWSPRTVKGVERALPAIIERTRRLYQGRADVLSVRVMMVDEEGTTRLRMKPGDTFPHRKRKRKK